MSVPGSSSFLRQDHHPGAQEAPQELLLNTHRVLGTVFGVGGMGPSVLVVGAGATQHENLKGCPA